MLSRTIDDVNKRIFDVTGTSSGTSNHSPVLNLSQNSSRGGGGGGVCLNSNDASGSEGNYNDGPDDDYTDDDDDDRDQGKTITILRVF